MIKNSRGMTLIEMIVVITLISIASVVILSRVQDTRDIETFAKVDWIRNHIRYAQALAMKQNNLTWGIKCDGSVYWLFKTNDPDTATEPDSNDNIIYLPGEESKTVSTSGIDEFAIYFNKYGVPYEYVSGSGRIEKISTALLIQIDDETLSITPETGYIP